MFGRVLFSIVVAGFLISCAEPKYAQPKPAMTEKQNSLSCDVRFQNDVCGHLQWVTEPTTDDFGSFLLQVFNGNPTDGSDVLTDLKGELSVILWMPSMGHGSSPVTVSKVDVGTYKINKVFFSMKGEWEIRFILKLNNEINEQFIYNFNF
jgi:hypothetical protein